MAQGDPQPTPTQGAPDPAPAPAPASGPGDPTLSCREDVELALRALLVARGVSDEEIDCAIAEDRIDLLVVDCLLLPGMPVPHTGPGVSEAAGIPEEQALRLWRALGFPEPGDATVFTDQDVAALRTIRGMAELGVSTEESSVQVTRVLGSSMARLADAFVGASDAALGSKPRPC
ncbi:MAG: adenylate cyclase regulatory domain-containing protein, partial [Acidimicrobiales bacterium]